MVGSPLTEPVLPKAINFKQGEREPGGMVWVADSAQSHVEYQRWAELVRAKRIYLTHAYYTDFMWTKQQPSSEPSRFADNVVEIVQRLCGGTNRPSFEFTIATDGSFTIRSVKSTASRGLAPSIPVEEEVVAIKNSSPVPKPN